MSLTSSSSSRDRNKYGAIQRGSINFFKGCSVCYCNAPYRQVLLFVCLMNHIPPYLFRSREDDDDVRYIGKHDFRSVELHPLLSNANHTEVPSIVKLVGLSTITSSFTGSWSSAISFFFPHCYFASLLSDRLSTQ